jgi:hypothetical protein
MRAGRQTDKKRTQDSPLAVLCRNSPANKNVHACKETRMTCNSHLRLHIQTRRNCTHELTTIKMRRDETQAEKKTDVQVLLFRSICSCSVESLPARRAFIVQHSTKNSNKNTHTKVLTYEDGKRSYTERETVLNRCDARLCKNDYTELNTQIRITTDNDDTTMQHDVNGRVEIRWRVWYD